MNKNQALSDLKNRYVKVGDPLYMSTISTIKKHYENVLTVSIKKPLEYILTMT